MWVFLGPGKNFCQGEKILVLMQLFNTTVLQQMRSWAALVRGTENKLGIFEGKKNHKNNPNCSSNPSLLAPLGCSTLSCASPGCAALLADTCLLGSPNPAGFGQPPFPSPAAGAGEASPCDSSSCCSLSPHILARRGTGSCVLLFLFFHLERLEVLHALL